MQVRFLDLSSNHPLNRASISLSNSNRALFLFVALLGYIEFGALPLASSVWYLNIQLQL